MNGAFSLGVGLCLGSASGTMGLCLCTALNMCAWGWDWGVTSRSRAPHAVGDASPTLTHRGDKAFLCTQITACRVWKASPYGFRCGELWSLETASSVVRIKRTGMPERECHCVLHVE